MPQQVNFKGLAIIEYPDDWSEERIREDARINEKAITARITEALKAQAVAETDADPNSQAEGFMENLGGAAGSFAEGVAGMVKGAAGMYGRAFETLPPGFMGHDPRGGTPIPPDVQRLWDSQMRQRAAESPEQRVARIESSPAVQWGKEVMARVQDAVPTLPGQREGFWTGAIPQGLGTTVGGIAAGLVGGPLAAGAAMFGAEAEDAWDEELMRQSEAGETPNPDKALLKAFGYGAFASAVETGLGAGRLTRSIQEAFGGRSAKEAVRRAAEKGALPRILARTVKEAGAGFTEEAVQRLGQSIIVEGKPDIEGAIQEGAAGAIIQPFLDIPANIATARKKPSLPRTAQVADRMQQAAGPRGVIEAPPELSEEDVARIEGVQEAVEAANKPREIPPLPVMTPGTAQADPIAEAPSALAEQIRLTADPQSSKAATLITPGEETPDYPDDLQAVKTRHGLVIFNPDKIGPDEVADAARGDVFDARILGMSASAAPVQSTIVVTTSTPAARNVVTEVVPEEAEAIAAATQAQQAAVPGGTTEVKPAIEVAFERQDDAKAEGGTVEQQTQTQQTTGEGGPTAEDALAIFKQEGKASVSLLQRKLKIGYSKAQALVDELEKRGEISPAQGAAPRTITGGQKPAEPGPPAGEQPAGNLPPAEAPKAPQREKPSPGGRDVQVPAEAPQGAPVSQPGVPPGRPEPGDVGGEPTAKGGESTNEKEVQGAQEEVTPQPAPPKEGEAPAPQRGKVGQMLAEGEVVLTKTGRKTTPFPALRWGSNRKGSNTVKRVEQWLMENALAEAESLGDEFNARQFGTAVNSPTQSDKDSAEEYLFGDSPPIVPPKKILKPLTTDEPGRTEGQPVASPPGVATGEPAPSGAGNAPVEPTGAVPGPEVPGGTPDGGAAQGKRPGRKRGVRGGDAGTPSPGGPAAGQPAEPAVSGPAEGDSPIPASADPVLADPAPEPVPEPKKPEDRNHVLPADADWIPNGAKTRARANIEAIKLLKALEAENRAATPAEKEILAKYVGWGAIPQAFDASHEQSIEYAAKGYYVAADTLKAARNWQKDWGAIYGELKGLLTPAERYAAKESTINAHYTSRTIINSLWAIVRKAGFRGGRALEPATGIGNIVGLIPEDLRERTRWDGSELDSLTARMAAKLYPEMRIQETGFESTKFRRGMFDLVISNVPFAKAGPQNDPRYPLLSLHNYFFARALDLTKPGGIVVFITSESTMNAPVSREAREYIAQHADLVGAIALPNDAFKANAGTEVTTDILILRRRDGSPFTGQPWIRTVDTKTHDGKPTIINEYYAAHPEMLLGKVSLEGKLHGGGDQRALLPIEGANLEDQLASAIEQLPADYFGAKAIPADVVSDEPQAAGEVKLGQLVWRDGAILHNVDGKLVKPEWAGSAGAVRQARAYVAMRDANIRLIDLQSTEEATDEEIEKARAELNKTYDAYVVKHGKINGRGSAWLEDDVDYYTCLALEDPKTEVVKVGEKEVRQTTWNKAPIFERRTIFPRTAPTKAENAVDAINISVNFRGRIDLAYVGQLLGLSPEDAEHRIIAEKAGFRNPETSLIETPAEYLSGPVRAKLEAAKVAAEEDPAFQRNVDELEKVQPPSIPIERIRVRLGAQWVPTGAIEDFMSEVIGVEAKVALVPGTSRWTMTIARGQLSANNLSKWGFKTESGTVLYRGDQFILEALNLKNALVTKKETRVGQDGGTYQVEVKDVDASLLAQEKQNALKQAFQEWAKTNAKWAPTIEVAFNLHSNGSTWPRFNASTWDHFPGASTDTILRPHQKEVVARILQNSTLLAHAVGTGKTYILITAAMEMKRLGLAKKPMIVVQPATLEQFARSFRRLYPSARILVPNKNQRTQKERNATMSRIATGEWDCVVVPHQWVDMMPDDPARETAYVQDRIEKLERARIQAALSAGEKSPTVKELVKAIKKLREKLANLLSRKKDEGLTFEQIGVDALMVDEAHRYKKLEFETQKENIKGLDKGASERGLGMFLKVRWVQERNQGRNVVFATGTPVSNTIAEAWTMMRFVRPDVLKRFGIEDFDQFDTTHGDTVLKWEMQPGGDYKQVERYARFTNGVPLITAWRTVADVKRADEVDLPGIPAIKGGARRSLAIKITPNLERFVQVLLARLRAFAAMTGRERRKNSHIPVVTFGEAKKATLDMRMADPDLPDEPGSKLNVAVAEIVRIYKESRDVRGAQMVFSDSVRDDSKKPRFNAHQELKRKLIEAGIPEEEILVVDDKIKDDRRELAFSRLNSGDIAVAIGTSERMGVGVNAQEHLIALHHLDAPHRPMDIEQREGRILRQGNQNLVVEIIAYGVEGTLDSALFDRLVTKQTFINQILSGDVTGDEFEDAANEATMSFSEQMAAFSGNPLLLERFALQQDLEQLLRSKTAHAVEMRRAQAEIVSLERITIPEAETDMHRAREILADMEKAFGNPPFPWSINGREMDNKAGIEALDKILETFAARARKAFEGQVMVDAWKTPMTELKGQVIKIAGREVQIAVAFDLTKTGTISADGTPSWHYQLVDEQRNWNGFSSATGLVACLRNRPGHAKMGVQNATDYLARKKTDLRQLQELIKSPFPRENDIAQKTARLAEIERLLKATSAKEKKPEGQQIQFGQTADGQGFFYVDAPRPQKSLGRRRDQIRRMLAEQERLAEEWEDRSSDPAAVPPPGYRPQIVPHLEAALKVVEESMMGQAKRGEVERYATAPAMAPAAWGAIEQVKDVTIPLDIEADVVYEPGWVTYDPEGRPIPIAAKAASRGRPMQLNAAVLAKLSKKEIQAIIQHEAVHPELATAWGVAQLGLFELTADERKTLQASGYSQGVRESDADYEIRLKDEFVAHEAERDTPWWRKFLDRVRAFLAKVGLAKLSNQEIARQILRAIDRRRADRAEDLLPVPMGPPRMAARRPTLAQAGKPVPGKDKVRDIGITPEGRPIQPGERRTPSQSEFGSPAYVRQKERERQLFAENFIAGHPNLKSALGAVGAIEDEAFMAVTVGEIIARASEDIGAPMRAGAMDPIDAQRIVERGTKLLQSIKTESAQAVQAQKQVNERLGPFRAVLSYLELIRTRQQRVLGKKYPSVVSDNIRSWLRLSARQAVEAVARQMKDKNNVATRRLRAAAADLEIPWSALFQSSWETQRQVQEGLYRAIRQHPDLSRLTIQEARELTNLFIAAWAREHDRIFQAEFRKHVQVPGGRENDMRRLIESLPRIVRWLNLGVMDDDRFRQAVAPAYGIASLDDAEVIRLSELAQKAQKTPQGSQRNRVYQEMIDIIVASQGISTYDLLRDFWFANVLSGLRTWIDVGVGSWLAGFTMTARAAADLSVRGHPVLAARMFSSFIRATGEGIANAADIVAKGDTSRLADTEGRLWDQLSGKGRPDTLEAAKRFGNGWQRAIGQMAYVRRIMVGLDYVGALGARDAMVIYTAASRGDMDSLAVAMRRFDKSETTRAKAQARAELGAQAKSVDVLARQREILEEGIAEEIKEGANTLGKVAALNADPVGMGGILYSAIARLPWIARAVSGLSFARAAINMAQNATDWLPVAGLINYGRALASSTDYFQNLPDRHPFRLFGLDVPPERRRLILTAQIGGLALTAVAWGLFLDGDDDDDRAIDIAGTWSGIPPRQKGQLLSQGEKPLSIRVGAAWISYRNTPFAAALAFIGNMRDRQRFDPEAFKGMNPVDRLLTAWVLGALYVKDVSAMSQLSQVIGAAAIDTKDDLASVNKSLSQTIGNAAAGFIPGVSFLREVDSITSPQVFRPNAGMEYWLRNIPFARRAVGSGPAINALGDPIEAARMPWGRWISERPDDPEWALLARLANKGAFLPQPSKTALIVGMDGSRRQMTPGEFFNYQREAGQLWRTELQRNARVLEDADGKFAEAFFQKRIERVHNQARRKVRPEE